MKRSFAILLTPVVVLFYAFNSSNPLYVDGKLVIHGHAKRTCRFQVFVKADDRIVANAAVDTSGVFELSFTPNHEKSFDFFYVDSHHSSDTIFLKSYQEFESDELKVVFYTFKGVMAVDDDDRITCPKCGQSDNVTPLTYLPGYYYCGRDRIKF